MATIYTLVAGGVLVRLDPGLPSNEQETRLIHMSLRLRDWMAEKLPVLVPRWVSELSPQEQLAAFIENFCRGTVLQYPRQFHSLFYIEDGIWELKTADVRVIGWFHAIDCFIGVVADDATRIKQIGLTHGYCGEVKRFRDQLDLDEPKYIKGSDPNDVVSNYYST